MKKIRLLITVLIAIALVGGYYYYLSSQNTSTEETVELTEVQNVILKNIKGDNYPATPREVLKLYNRVISCFYNETYTSEEFDQLTDKSRELLDEDLLAINPKEAYATSLKAEVDFYKGSEKTIRYSTVSESNEVKYKTIEGRECAYLNSSYLLKDGSGNDLSRSNQKYLLRKDEQGKWKILAFELIKGESSENE